MIKADLIDRVADRTGIQKTIISKVIEASLSEIVAEVSSGEQAILRGFGTFTCETKREKVGRNFADGGNIVIPERTIPVFRPSESFKNRVKERVT